MGAFNNLEGSFPLGPQSTKQLFNVDAEGGRNSSQDAYRRIALNDNENKTYRLTFADAVVVWLRHWAGEFQHHIAASFRVNPGRINEVLKGHKHIGSREEAEKKFKQSA